MNTGLRRGEVLKVRWSFVDFSRRLLTVEGRSAKNRQTRHVPLNEEALNVLRRWREQSGVGTPAFDVATGFGLRGEGLSSARGSANSAGTICVITLLRAWSSTAFR
jgi:integrase